MYFKLTKRSPSRDNNRKNSSDGSSFNYWTKSIFIVNFISLLELFCNMYSFISIKATVLFS
jgi:hypothetical protein